MSVCHNLARMNNEKARVSQDFTDIEPRLQPAMPLRRPHGNTPNNKREYQERGDAGDTRNSAGSVTSKASVKSGGSCGKEERFNKFQEKPKQPASSYKQRFFNKERQDDTVKASAAVAKPESSKMEEQSNKLHAVFNRDVPKIEPVKPAAAPSPGPNLTPKTSVPDPPTAKPAAFKPQEDVPPPKETTPVVKPASVSDTTPTKKLVPKNYLLQKCKVGDSIVMSLEAKASECRISRGDFVCLTMAEAFEADYSSLCTDYANEFNSDDPPAKLIPGETISYLNPEDGGWYRARCLNPTTLALIDSSRIVTVTPADEIRKVPSKYEAMPEFCAVLASKDVELGANLNCKILSQTSEGYKVSLTSVETGAHIGEAEVFRWLPTIEYPTAAVAIPQVSRRPLVDGSKVVLVLANSLDEVYVRPAENESQRKYDDVIQEVLLTSMKAEPLSEPPRVGHTVISKYTDGAFYRALVRRINVAKNKYQIEYAEYGNIEVSTLENLYKCPADCDLANAPTEVSKVKLAPPTELTAPALQLIQELLEEEELVLTLPNGVKTAPSGSEATLTIVRNKVNLGEKLVDLCKPEWKKIEERGGTIGETKPMSFEDLVYTELPEGDCTIRVLDSSLLQGGIVCGHCRDDPNADLIFNKLTAKMADYCNSQIAKYPYMPAVEELCIAQLPPHPQWFRAVYVSPVSNEGGNAIGKMYYLDYGYIAKVPMKLVRKMMPEFVTDLPIMGLYLQIRDFPEDPSDEMIARGLAHMQVDGDGKGILKVSGWEKHEDAGTLIVDAPELIAAVRG